MSLYTLSLFLHVVGAVALGVILSFELATVLGVRRATTTQQAAQWLKVLRAPGMLGRPAGPIVLLSGIYLSVTRWGAQGWIIAGLTAVVLIAVLDPALSARRLATITKSLPPEDGPVSPNLGRLLRDPMLRVSISLRMALFLCIVFLMCTKPGAAVAFGTVVVSLIAGGSAALPLRSGATRRTPEATPAPTR